MPPFLLKEGDLLHLKKKHPCGGDLFQVLRVGSDVRILCRKCGRDITIPRVKLEPNIRQLNTAPPPEKEP